MGLADLFEWTNAAIFDDLGSHTIAPAHRDLQRRFADLELEIALLPSASLAQIGVTTEIQSLARYELRKIDARLNGANAAAADVATKAHLDDLRSRIGGGIHPGTLRPL